MPVIEPSAPLRLLRAGYAPDDWVAVFLKSYATGETCQRVASISQVSRPEFLAWLRSRNASAWNVYVSVNGVSPQSRSRSRQSVAAIRHVFLEADEDGPRVLARIAARADLPPPSYLLHSSRHRVHVFWRVSGFDIPRVEALQKQLARELKTDTAATSCSQLTRLPGLFNHKRQPAELVTMVYGRRRSGLRPGDFPAAEDASRADCRRQSSTTFRPTGGSNARAATWPRCLPRLPVATAICTRSGSAAALCAASRSTTARPSHCCRSGTLAVSRRGLIANWNRRSPAPGVTVVSRSAGCWRHGDDPSSSQVLTQSSCVCLHNYMRARVDST